MSILINTKYTKIKNILYNNYMNNIIDISKLNDIDNRKYFIQNIRNILEIDIENDINNTDLIEIIDNITDI